MNPSPPLRIAAPPAPTGLAWIGGQRLTGPALEAALVDLQQPVVLIEAEGQVHGVQGGEPAPLGRAGAIPLRGLLPAQDPGRLGSAAFRAAHRVRLSAAAGAMANGIAGEALVTAMAQAGLLSSLGAAGLPLDQVEAISRRLRASLGAAPWAVNLIHSPDAPARELELVRRCADMGVETLEASAFMAISPAAIAWSVGGLALGPDGLPQQRRRLIVKLSRLEVAEAFLRPPAPERLAELVAAGLITPTQARMGAALPVATDITVEADSGGHTDRRALVCLFPAIAALRDQLPEASAVRLGAAGGMGRPEAIAAAFALGADYVVTGSINQASVEAATSDAVKQALARAQPEDVTLAPCADMFEQGVKVQVLQRGSLYASRARRLYELYSREPSLEALAGADRAFVEGPVLGGTIEAAWQSTQRWVTEHNPDLLRQAAADPKVRMALVFRSYLGQSSDWAVRGRADRAMDYQIWCGPAMGAFNQWVAGSPLAPLPARGIVTVHEALWTGAAQWMRRQALRAAGLSPRPGLLQGVPMPAPAPPSSPPAPRPLPPPPAATATIDPSALTDWLVTQIAREVRRPESEIDTSAPFASLDIDSKRAISLLAALEQKLGRRLSPTIIWNYPNIDRLAARLSRG